MQLWCEYAWLGGATVARGVTVRVDDGVITAIESGVDPLPEATVLSGVTLPGLANVHSHAFQRSLRARTQRQRGSFWTWREAMYEAAAGLDPDGYERLATAVFGEMALAGITLVGEFHYVHHQADGASYDDPNAIGKAVARAAANAGVRLTLIDACYLHGGFDVPVDGVQRRFADADAGAWAERVDALADGPTLRVAGAAHSVRALAPDELVEVARWAQSRSAPLHAHVSEQRRENDECVAAHGRTPVELLADTGCLEADFTAVHATHVTDSDLGLLGDVGATCCLCPTTERDLADGIGPAAHLAQAGCALALGSDSNAVIDMFEEARALELDQRLASEQRVSHEPHELVAAATGAGYRALGWDGGALRAGACADLVSVRLDSVRMAGTRVEDLVAGIVFAAHPTDVRDVMVAGDWIVRGGRHLTLDVASELERALR